MKIIYFYGCREYSLMKNVKWLKKHCHSNGMSLSTALLFFGTVPHPPSILSSPCLTLLTSLLSFSPIVFFFFFLTFHPFSPCWLYVPLAFTLYSVQVHCVQVPLCFFSSLSIFHSFFPLICLFSNSSAYSFSTPFFSCQLLPILSPRHPV